MGRLANNDSGWITTACLEGKMKLKQNKLEETVIFRCQKTLFDTLKKMASERGLTISQLVRSLLEETTQRKE